MYVENHFGVFGNLKVNQLTTAKIEEFISAGQKSGMPLKTVKYLIGLLNRIMKYAVRHQYRESNPVSSAERPRESSEQKGSILAPDEINRLLNAEKNMMYHNPVQAGCIFRRKSVCRPVPLIVEGNREKKMRFSDFFVAKPIRFRVCVKQYIYSRVDSADKKERENFQ